MSLSNQTKNKNHVQAQLERVKWKVDYVFSHTVPLSYEPQEEFLPNIDQSQVDKSTEQWLNTIERKLDYERWYAGHFHLSCVQQQEVLVYLGEFSLYEKVSVNGKIIFCFMWELRTFCLSVI